MNYLGPIEPSHNECRTHRMAVVATRGMPAEGLRARPNILPFIPVPVHQGIVSDTEPSIFLEEAHTHQSSSSDAEAAPAAAHSLDNTSTSVDTFPPGIEERGSHIPDIRVTPPTPIVTPKSDDEELVPGRELAHRGQRLSTKEKSGATCTLSSDSIHI